MNENYIGVEYDLPNIEDMLDSEWDPDLVAVGKILKDHKAFLSVCGFEDEDIITMLSNFIQDPNYSNECVEQDNRKIHIISFEDSIIIIIDLIEAEGEYSQYDINVNDSGLELLKSLMGSKYQPAYWQ